MIRMLPLGRSVLLGLLLIFCCSMALQAQSTRVKGTILDAAAQTPIVGASVAIPKLGLGGFTNEKGEFSLNLPSTETQSLKLSISYAGYKTQILDLNEFLANPKPVALESNDYTAEDVVITATKGFEQAQSDVTVSIAVVKPRSIDLQALPAVDKAISQIPGVDNQDGQINIRGSSGYAYGVGSRVMVTLDGLPLLTGDAGAADLDLIPVDNIAQIEVMKGASSVLYGSSALGGVINVITADPGEKPRTAIRVRGGIFDTPSNPDLDWDGDASAWSGSAHVFHSRRIGNLDLTFQTNFIKESGYREGTDTEEYRNVLMLKYRPESVKGLTFGLNASLSVDSSGQILYWRGYYPDTTIQDNDTIVSGGALTPTLDDGGFRRQLKTIMALDPVIKYLTPKGDLFWYRGRFLRNSNSNDADQSTVNNIFYNDFLYQTTLGKNISWVSGATFTTANIQGDSLYGGTYVLNGDTITSDGGHTSNSFGIYTQFDGKFGPLNASLGFRYETVQINDGAREAQPTVRLGLNYKIAEGTNARASFGQAFRVPSIAERFANTSGGGVVVEPNPNIQSERGYSAEVALRQGFKSVGRTKFKGYLDLAAFTMRYEDMVEFGIQRDPDNPFAVAFSSINVADARINGLELTGLGQLERGKWLATFSGGWTLLDPLDLNAVPDSIQLDLVAVPSDIINANKVDRPPFLKYRSRHTIRFSGTIGYGPVSFTANYRAKSFVQNIDQYLFIVVNDLNDFRTRYPNGEQVWDMIAAVDLGKKNTIALTVDNVFNSEYLIIPGFLAPQRKFTLQYQIKF